MINVSMIKPCQAMYFNTNLGFYILFEKWMVMTTGDLGKNLMGLLQRN